MSAAEYPGAVSAKPRAEARNTSAPSNRFAHLCSTPKPFPSLYGGGPIFFNSSSAMELPSRASSVHHVCVCNGQGSREFGVRQPDPYQRRRRKRSGRALTMKKPKKQIPTNDRREQFFWHAAFSSAIRRAQSRPGPLAPSGVIVEADAGPFRPSVLAEPSLIPLHDRKVL